MGRTLLWIVLAPLVVGLSLLGTGGASQDEAPQKAVERGGLVAFLQEAGQRGWRTIAILTWNETMEDRLFAVAAGVAFYTLLALVPGLSVVVSIYGLLADPVSIASHLQGMMTLMPAAVAEIVMEQATRIAARPATSLSLTLVFNIALAAFSANAAIKAMFDALNVIYDEEEKRGYLRFHLLALSMTIGAAVLLVLLLVLAAVVPIIIRHFPYEHGIARAILVLRWPAFFLVATLGIAILYRIGPSRGTASFVRGFPGAALASLLWAAVSSAFAWYVATLSDYAATYGSLAAVIVFMTWLWLSASVILLGAQLNSTLEAGIAERTGRAADRSIAT